MNFTTIFFDWGGVLADDPGDGFLKQLLHNLGAREAQIEEIYTSYMFSFMQGHISEESYWHILREKYGFSIHDSISDEFKKWRGLEVNQEILQLVIDARAAGFQVAMLSNIIEPTYKVLLSTGHLKHFDKIIASCEVGCAKPQPEIYTLALESLHCTAQQAVFIDDKQKNLDPAAALGITTILAENPLQIKHDISALISSKSKSMTQTICW